MGATKNRIPRFHAVTDDFRPAAIALWRHGVDRTFEAVEDVRFTVAPNLKCFVVLVSAMCAPGHDDLPA
jgi:hypothetical protein